jgi:hypothetical protein
MVTPHSDRASIQRCPRCHATVIRALVGNPCGFDVRADPQPLDLQQELTARLAGQLTFCLVIRPWIEPRIRHRGPEHITSGRCTHTVIAEHQCPGRP